jgi:hypothetical protein
MTETGAETDIKNIAQIATDATRRLYINKTSIHFGFWILDFGLTVERLSGWAFRQSKI